MSQLRSVLSKLLLSALTLGLLAPDVRAVQQESQEVLEKRREEAFKEGRRLFFQGEFEAAKQRFREANLIHKKVYNRPGILYFNYEGLCYQYQDELDHALAIFNEALRLRESLVGTGDGDPEKVADSLNNIGWVHFLKGNYVQALESLNRAEAIVLDFRKDDYGALSSGWYRGRILTNLGIVHRAVGNHSLAFKYLRYVVEQSETHNDKMCKTRAFQNLGDLERSWGNLAKALQYYEKAVQVGRDAYDQVYNQAYLVDALTELGTLYGQMQRFDRAHAVFQEALTISRKLGTRRLIARTLLNLGNLARDQDHLETAFNYHQEALSLSEEAALRPIMGQALAELGWDWLQMRNPQQAIQFLQQALEAGRETLPPEVRTGVYSALAEAYETLKDLKKAAECYRLTIESIEKVRVETLTEDRKIGYWQTKQTTFERAVSLLHRLHEQNPGTGYNAEAFAYAERARARAFLDLLAEAKVKPSRGLSPELQQEEQAIFREIAKIRKKLLQEGLSQAETTELERDLSTAEERLQEFQQRLRITHPAYAELQYPQPFGLKRVQEEVLGSDTLLLEFTLGEEKSFLWAVSKEKCQMVALPARAEIERQVRSYRQVITSPPSGKESFDHYFYRASRLYHTLLKPIENTLKSYSNLIIVPDGILHYLPFETLVARQPTRRTLKSRLLLSNPRISYASSASALGLLQTARAKSNAGDARLLACADPILTAQRRGAESAEGHSGIRDARYGMRDSGIKMRDPASRIAHPAQPARLGGETRLVDVTRSLYRERGRSFAPLPYAREEVKSIAALYHKTAFKLYVGREATESSFKRERPEQFNQLHFATHGLIDEEVPARSGVVFSLVGGEEEDGILQMSEVFNLNLNAELAVLSACQSGLGKLVRGEGMIGLTRAFMYAGASSVVVSLWNVRDSSTAEFMKNFYKRLRAGNSKAEALRQAKLDMLHSDKPAYRHPYFWAAFVLIGGNAL